MQIASPFSRFLRVVGLSVLLGPLGLTLTSQAQDMQRVSLETAPVIVADEGVPSAYGAPASMSRSRFANLTNAYVLPAWSIYAGIIYEGDALRYDHPDHIFTQEIEVGLPYRFGVAVENGVEAYRGDGQGVSTSVEVRYALADWDKIPLNPTLFAEYRFGIGKILVDEGAPMRPVRKATGDGVIGDADAADAANAGPPGQPDAIEVRLLLSEDFRDKIEWAMNFFFEQEVQGDRGREWGFAQSFLAPVFLPQERLKLGVELQYRNFTDKGSRDDPAQSFVLGPTVAFKPTRNTRFDLSPLFGVTFDAPRVQCFAVFSYTFGPLIGGGGGHESEEPASTRNR